MSQLRSNTSLELEIQALLLHHQTADLAADALLKKYENENLKLNEMESICQFLLSSGFYYSLVRFLISKLKKKIAIPWAYFAEALFRSGIVLNSKTKEALFQGAQEWNALPELARSYLLHHEYPELRDLKKAISEEQKQSLQKIRKDLLNQAELMQSQNLYQDEEKVIAQLALLFPNDPEILTKRADLRQRLAGEIIAKKPKPKNKLFVPEFEILDAESRKILECLIQSMHQALAEDTSESRLPEDFAIALLILEDPQAALEIVSYARPSISRDWLLAELYSASRRFVDLLNHLTWLEATYGQDPECLFSVQYLRSKAYWGLNQKNKAIEILEGMVATRPHYRAAHSLLNQWKEELYE